MSTFTKVTLYTDHDGYARFREEEVPLSEGTPQAMLSALTPAKACQFRQSPVGFRSQFHCTTEEQWLFVLGGEMKIGLQDGSSRNFKAGQHFYSADTLPAHWTFGLSSRAVRDVMVAGRFVVRDRRLTTVDQEALAADARTEATRLWERLDAIDEHRFAPGEVLVG